MRRDATLGESAMLTKPQRRSITRALTKAYYAYRDLSLLQTCRGLKIRLFEQDEGGSVNSARGSTKHEWDLCLPDNQSSDHREHIFWHEVGHIVLDPFQDDEIFWQPLIGYQGDQQMFWEETWVQERLCEAFADMMFLYRRGLLIPHPRSIGRFLFADKSSVGYAELNRFSVVRIERYYKKALRTRKNVDLMGIEKMLSENRRKIHFLAFQQELPTDFPDTHQTPYITYVEG